MIQEAAHEDANIIFGAVIDPNLSGKLKITVIATGFQHVDSRRGAPAAATATPTDLSSYAQLRAEPAPQSPEEYPFRVIAPAYLLSEVTTGILIGFYIYLPFLVVDLVVSAVLAAAGLFMLPPAMVAIPIKLILFVLADGGILVPTMLMRSFGPLGG